IAPFRPSVTLDNLAEVPFAIANYTDSIEGRLMRSLKSVLGGTLVNEKTRIKSRSIAFTEIIGLFVGHLRKRLEEDADDTVESVVLGRPVQFVDDDAEADAKAEGELENAARTQGFKHIAFQFEPIAAALDYEQNVTREELALIVDMGGGTSDFSIVRVSPQRARSLDRKDDILASRGIHIGGTDFDRLLSIAHVMPQLGYLSPTKDGKRNLPASYFIDLATWQRINLVYTARAMTHLRQIRYEAERADLVDRFIHIVEHRYGHALAALVETAKIALTEQLSGDVVVALPGASFAAEISRAGLEATIAREIERVAAT
ncbi:MAG: Hsp70 family protein, partial [Mesorhizobium sp.]